MHNVEELLLSYLEIDEVSCKSIVKIVLFWWKGAEYECMMRNAENHHCRIQNIREGSKEETVSWTNVLKYMLLSKLKKDNKFWSTDISVQKKRYINQKNIK